ncbi:hypothetical protein ACNKHN_21380 [Shigella flexneri]
MKWTEDKLFNNRIIPADESAILDHRHAFCLQKIKAVPSFKRQVDVLSFLLMNKTETGCFYISRIRCDALQVTGSTRKKASRYQMALGSQAGVTSLFGQLDNAQLRHCFGQFRRRSVMTSP